MLARREFIRRAAFAVLPVAFTAQDTTRLQGRPPANLGGTAADTLAMPVGRPSAPLGPLDNDPGVIAIETRLRCNCGCTLDVYTCRTTDFTCTYSPAMHAKVVAHVQRGETAEQIIQWFVAQPEYGEKVLMAPKPQGFNLMGYIVPGLTMTAVGLALAAWLVRRRPASETPGGGGGPAAPGTGGAPPDPEQLARLKRALDEVES